MSDGSVIAANTAGMPITRAEHNGFYTRAAVLMAILVLLSFPLTYYLVVIPFLIALTLHDRRNRGSVHAATLCGIVLLLPLQLSSAWIARSDAWNRIAPWLLGSG